LAAREVLEVLRGGEEIGNERGGMSSKALHLQAVRSTTRTRNVHEVHTAKLDAAEEFIEAANGKPRDRTRKHELARLLVRLKKYKPVRWKPTSVKDWTLARVKYVMHPSKQGHS
jgi:hypothetical protein